MKEYIGVIFFLMCLQIANSQELKFSEPVKLGPEINSEDEELAPMLSPDGNTLYFARAFHDRNTGGKYAGTDIWISRKDANGNWLPAVNAGKPWNNKRSNAVIGISRDHKTVYLLNAYNNKSGIAFSKLVHDKWTKPEFVPVPGINRDDFVGVYVHPDFDVMVISMKGEDSYGEEDLYVSLKDSLSNWSKPQNLGPTINTKGFEIAPFLTEDKKRIFFSSSSQTGLGNADLFYSDQLFDSWVTWTAPKNLSGVINSNMFEGGVFIDYDSSDVYFSKFDSEKTNIFKSSFLVSSSLMENYYYLNKNEIELLIGVKTNLDLKFESSTNILNSSNQELLWFIVGRILSKKNIKLILESCHEFNNANARILSIQNQLLSAGLEGSRIIKSENCSLPNDVIRINLVTQSN